MISTLDNPTEGNVVINGKDITYLKEKEVASFRRSELGFVFQDFNLLDTFSNRDNIYLPLVLSGYRHREMRKKLEKIEGILGISKLLEKYPYQVSGGQKQRIAIARAIITEPSILLADEPTGALDSSSSQNILDLFTSINESGQTILMVTHSVRSAACAKRVMFIKDGIVFHELYKGDKETIEDFSERILQSQKVLNKRGV